MNERGHREATRTAPLVRVTAARHNDNYTRIHWYHLARQDRQKARKSGVLRVRARRWSAVRSHPGTLLQDGARSSRSGTPPCRFPRGWHGSPSERRQRQSSPPRRNDALRGPSYDDWHGICRIWHALRPERGQPGSEKAILTLKHASRSCALVSADPFIRPYQARRARDGGGHGRPGQTVDNEKR